MKAMYQEGIFAVEKWQNNTDLEGNFEDHLTIKNCHKTFLKIILRRFDVS